MVLAALAPKVAPLTKVPTTSAIVAVVTQKIPNILSLQLKPTGAQFCTATGGKVNKLIR